MALRPRLTTGLPFSQRLLDRKKVRVRYVENDKAREMAHGPYVLFCENLRL
jgi:hypothetical protein